MRSDSGGGLTGQSVSVSDTKSIMVFSEVAYYTNTTADASDMHQMMGISLLFFSDLVDL